MKVHELMSPNVFTVERDHHMVITEQLLKWRRIRHVPVVDRGRVVGLVSHRDLWKAATSSLAKLTRQEQNRRDKDITVNDIMNTNIVTIRPDDDITLAVTLMLKKGISCLLVVKKAKLFGILTCADFLKLALKIKDVPSAWQLTLQGDQPLYVQEVMSKDVFKLNADAKLSLLEDVMDWNHIRHVPVVDSEDNLVGIVTHRDLMKAMVSAHELLSRSEQHEMFRYFKVFEIMNLKPLTTTRFTKLVDAAKVMYEKKIGSLPVVDGKRLNGMLTETDFLKLARLPRPRRYETVL